MLNVLLTVDTETHAICRDWASDGLSRDISRDIYGEVGSRRVGLGYQLEVLRQSGLKAVFMVEALFSAVPEIGTDPLKRIVRLIRDDGHDVQLHLHPDWVAHIPALGIPFRSTVIFPYEEAEQAQMLSVATDQLVASGAAAPTCFRAGGFGINRKTLSLLPRFGIRFDTSYNPFYTRSKCRLPAPKSSGHAEEMEGIIEFPVASFLDFRGKVRPCQIGACSSSEIIAAMNQAEKAGWDYFVIVSHSFEMLTRRRPGKGPVAVRENVRRRFERPCRFLADNRDRFRTIGFDDLDHIQLTQPERVEPVIRAPMLNTTIRVPMLNTLGRLCEQGYNRLYFG